MNLEKLTEMFEVAEKNVKYGSINDLQGFMLLDKLIPFQNDVVSAADHDQIWLDVDLEKLSEIITQEQVNMLYSSGMSIDEDNNSFMMFK